MQTKKAAEACRPIHHLVHNARAQRFDCNVSVATIFIAPILFLIRSFFPSLMYIVLTNGTVLNAIEMHFIAFFPQVLMY